MVYFDNAATTFPKPNYVLETVVKAIKIYGGNPGHGGHSIAMNTARKIYETREKVANFFNASVERVIFTQNCTMATNIAIKGVLEKGDHVIISDLEHNAVYRPINKLSTSGIISYDVAEVFDDDEKTLLEFKSKILHNTKAIVCTHSSNVTGKVLPINLIGKLCKENNIIFIVDSAQSAGVLPIDVEKDNIS
ncbi:MAG: aminotransferase class V-fold PLP-dependent enzyme, partial [Oscillospiraceae bacterium]